MRKVYLDNAATTMVDPRVIKAMAPYFDIVYANPSSFHSMGKQAENALEGARKSIANNLNCRPKEIIFCSGGTESDNMAVLGAARASQKNGNHIITSKIEHHAVLEPVMELVKSGEFRATYIMPDKQGIIDPKEVAKSITKKTILVSVMAANNEIGTIQPIAEIGREILKWRKKNNTPYPYFHTDACQAAGAMELNVEKLHVDFLTFNASKIYGPKGIGALYIRSGAKIKPLMFGGSQEMLIRPGTQNVAGAVGLAKALEIAISDRDKENKRLIKLRDYFIGELLKIKGTRLNGDAEKRLPNNINVSFNGIEGEAMVLYLDAKGIYVSSGSACTSRTLDPSHVVLACGLDREIAHSSVRFTLGKKTTREDLAYVLKVLPGIVEKLRGISPPGKK
jgi:cysteine desulfurase